MNARGVVFALTIGAAVLAAGVDAALAARGGGRRTPQTIELTRPAGAADADASGTVRITHGARGDRTTIVLSHLDPRTRYEVRDAGTGELLGRVRTNRKGRATFDLTRNLAKAASASWSDARGVSNVDIVDPSTGRPVLTGDVEPEPSVPQFGYADYAGESGETADVSMWSDPQDGIESFALEFFPVKDPDATKYSHWDLWLDTSNGDKLPLGVASVTELAGRRFEILAPDGTVVIDDSLPKLEPIDLPVFDDDWTGDWNGDPTGGSGGIKWPDDPFAGFDPNGFVDKPAGRDGSAKRIRKEDVARAYTLLIADAQGALQDAGRLKEETFDAPVDCPWTDPGSGWDFGGGVIGIVIFLPFDGSFDGTFDWEGFLADLLGGWGLDANGGGTTRDPFAGVRHRGR